MPCSRQRWICSSSPVCGDASLPSAAGTPYSLRKSPETSLQCGCLPQHKIRLNLSRRAFSERLATSNIAVQSSAKPCAAVGHQSDTQHHHRFGKDGRRIPRQQRVLECIADLSTWGIRCSRQGRHHCQPFSSHVNAKQPTVQPRSCDALTEKKSPIAAARAYWGPKLAPTQLMAVGIEGDTPATACEAIAQ
jgi:hypothetical protein